jgi:hypothetical protein
MAPSDKLIPAAHSDDQEDIMAGRHGEPIRLGSVPFSSYDPATEGRKMLPLQDGTSGAHDFIAGDEAEGDHAADYSDLKNPELKALVAERGLEADSNKNDDLRKALMAADAEEMGARDFIAAINEATTMEELDAAYAVYDAQETEYVTVDKAYDAKKSELDAS